jgi:hypothetical protein
VAEVRVVVPSATHICIIGLLPHHEVALANNYGLGRGGLLLRRRRSAGLQRVGEAWLLTLVMAGDGGMLHRYLRLLTSPGYPRSRNLGSDDANTLCVVLPWGIIFAADDVLWRQVVEWCASTTSITPSLGGMF